MLVLLVNQVPDIIKVIFNNITWLSKQFQNHLIDFVFLINFFWLFNDL